VASLDACAWVPVGKFLDVMQLLEIWLGSSFAYRCQGSDKVLQITLFYKFGRDLVFLCDLGHIVDKVIHVHCSRRDAVARRTQPTWAKRGRNVHLWRICVDLNGDLSMSARASETR
jgi:hypothetical protein